MKSKAELLQAIAAYEKLYEFAKENHEAIHSFIQSFDGNDLYSRKNFTGHLTASAFIFHPGTKSLLLIQHTTLNKWLQPGGHIEPTDKDLEAAALREAIEETGFPPNMFTLVPGIVDIDSHHIPANDRKQEPPHEHHDIRFLFTCAQAIVPNVQDEHVSGCKWIPMDDLPAEESIRRVAGKILQL